MCVLKVMSLGAIYVYFRSYFMVDGGACLYAEANK